MPSSARTATSTASDDVVTRFDAQERPIADPGGRRRRRLARHADRLREWRARAHREGPQRRRPRRRRRASTATARSSGRRRTRTSTAAWTARAPPAAAARRSRRPTPTRRRDRHLDHDRRRGRGAAQGRGPHRRWQGGSLRLVRERQARAARAGHARAAAAPTSQQWFDAARARCAPSTATPAATARCDVWSYLRERRSWCARASTPSGDGRPDVLNHLNGDGSMRDPGGGERRERRRPGQEAVPGAATGRSTAQCLLGEDKKRALHARDRAGRRRERGADRHHRRSVSPIRARCSRTARSCASMPTPTPTAAPDVVQTYQGGALAVPGRGHHRRRRRRPALPGRAAVPVPPGTAHLGRRVRRSSTAAASTTFWSER